MADSSRFTNAKVGREIVSVQKEICSEARLVEHKDRAHNSNYAGSELVTLNFDILLMGATVQTKESSWFILATNGIVSKGLIMHVWDHLIGH